MTILCAASGPDGTWIGADSFSSCGDRLAPEGDPKWNVSACGEWALAGPGEVTFDGILFGDPEWDPSSHLWPSEGGESGLRRMMAAMRKRLLDSGAVVPMVDDGDTTRCYRWSPMVVWAGGSVWRLHSTLWTFDRGYLFGEPESLRYMAHGCGAEYALGAMHAAASRVDGLERSAETLVRAGLDAACRFSSGCAPPLLVQRLGEGS